MRGVRKPKDALYASIDKGFCCNDIFNINIKSYLPLSLQLR